MFDFLQHEQVDLTKIYYDSKTVIKLSKNPIFHGRNKHININIHFIRELVQNQEIIIDYCKSKNQVADIFTKLLKVELFLKLEKMFGMIRFENIGLKEVM